jgi:hypothetical protein
MPLLAPDGRVAASCRSVPPAGQSTGPVGARSARDARHAEMAVYQVENIV